MGTTPRAQKSHHVDVTRVSRGQFQRMMTTPTRPSNELRDAMRERQRARRAS